MMITIRKPSIAALRTGAQRAKYQTTLDVKTVVARLILATLPCYPIASASADAPPGRYVIANGTVYDTKTKLTWQQAPSASKYFLADAKAYCSGTWRLPTVKELLTIVDDSRINASGMPAIDPVAFPGTPAYGFWSSTPPPGGGTGGWEVQFYSGFALSFGSDSRDYVRCVLR
jgi:hypothetical protein